MMPVTKTNISLKKEKIALRELWIATYKFVHATLWSSNEAAEKEFKTKEAELMAVINQTLAVAA